MKKTILFFWALLMLLSISMKAQTLSPFVISSTGGFYSAGNNALSITVAEMTMVQTFNQPANILTQGFQQPELLHDTTVSIGVIVSISNNVSLYPNPSNGQFNLRINATENTNYLIRIYDLIGQEVYSHRFDGSKGENIFAIDIKHYRQGVYLLTLNSNEKNKYEIFKINLVY